MAADESKEDAIENQGDDEAEGESEFEEYDGQQGQDEEQSRNLRNESESEIKEEALNPRSKLIIVSLSQVDPLVVIQVQVDPHQVKTHNSHKHKAPAI